MEKSAQSIENKGSRFARFGALMEPRSGDGRGLEREGRGRECMRSAAGKGLGRGRGAKFMEHDNTGSIPCQYPVLHGIHSNGALPEGRPDCDERHGRVRPLRWDGISRYRRLLARVGEEVSL